MDNKTVAISIAILAVGLVIGYVLAPQTLGRGPFMGGGVRGVDAHFIEQMIPHHEGAIAMAELALEKSADQRVRSLAQGIVDAQRDEVEQMQAWYQTWYGKLPDSGRGHAGMHMQSMEGDTVLLESAADFDKEFLRQMVIHHEAAVMMAQMLASGTTRPEMKELADNIITSQAREIVQMRSWLAGE